MLFCSPRLHRMVIFYFTLFVYWVSQSTLTSHRWSIQTFNSMKTNKYITNVHKGTRKTRQLPNLTGDILTTLVSALWSLGIDGLPPCRCCSAVTMKNVSVLAECSASSFGMMKYLVSSSSISWHSSKGSLATPSTNSRRLFLWFVYIESALTGNFDQDYLKTSGWAWGEIAHCYTSIVGTK